MRLAAQRASAGESRNVKLCVYAGANGTGIATVYDPARGWRIDSASNAHATRAPRVLRFLEGCCGPLAGHSGQAALAVEMTWCFSGGIGSSDASGSARCASSADLRSMS